MISNLDIFTCYYPNNFKYSEVGVEGYPDGLEEENNDNGEGK